MHEPVAHCTRVFISKSKSSSGPEPWIRGVCMGRMFDLFASWVLVSTVLNANRIRPNKLIVNRQSITYVLSTRIRNQMIASKSGQVQNRKINDSALTQFCCLFLVLPPEYSSLIRSHPGLMIASWRGRAIVCRDADDRLQLQMGTRVSGGGSRIPTT